MVSILDLEKELVQENERKLPGVGDRVRVRVLVVLRARVYRDGDLPDHRQGEGLRRVLQHLQGARQLDHGAAAEEVRLREEPRRVRRRVEVEGYDPARRSGRPVGRCARGTCR